MYNEVLYLVSYEPSENVDEYGDVVLTEKRTRRFTKIKSVSQSEFYQAQTAGLKPEFKIELADYLDYDGQEEVIYKDKRYKVLRTYRTDANSIELTLYGGVRDVVATVSDKN